VLVGDESASGVRRYLFASPSMHLEVAFAVDGATHDLVAPAGATVLGLDGAAVMATTVGADPVFVITP
jgi:hypothetical protein